MKLYHGSDVIIDKPRIIESNRLTDFGRGFYVTSSLDQAMNWSKRVNRRNNTATGWVSNYEFDLKYAKEELVVLEFDGPCKEWLEFVVQNRRGVCTLEYDVVIGPVADDSVYEVVNLFQNGRYTIEQAVVMLKTGKLQDQYLFHTEQSLAFLSFIGSEEVF